MDTDYGDLVMIRTASVALATGLFLTSAALGQQGGPDTVTIDFKGGTVEQYVDLLDREFDGGANIVIETAARDVIIAGVKLTITNPQNAAAAVEFLEINGSKVHLYTRGGPEFRVIGVEKAQPADEEFRETHVWSFSAFLEGGIEANDALSAIENALDLTGGRADVRYHEDTQLLMVNGTNAQLEAVDQVISRLNGVTNWRENRSRGRAETEVNKKAQDQIRELTMQRDDLMQRIAQLELHLIQLEGQINK